VGWRLILWTARILTIRAFATPAAKLSHHGANGGRVDLHCTYSKTKRLRLKLLLMSAALIDRKLKETVVSVIADKLVRTVGQGESAAANVNCRSVALLLSRDERQIADNIIIVCRQPAYRRDFPSAVLEAKPLLRDLNPLYRAGQRALELAAILGSHADVFCGGADPMPRCPQMLPE
jgi:hypothetical protein